MYVEWILSSRSVSLMHWQEYEEVIVPPAKPVPPRASERLIGVGELDDLCRSSFPVCSPVVPGRNSLTEPRRAMPPWTGYNQSSTRQHMEQTKICWFVHPQALWAPRPFQECSTFTLKIVLGKNRRRDAVDLTCAQWLQGHWQSKSQHRCADPEGPFQSYLCVSH